MVRRSDQPTESGEQLEESPTVANDPSSIELLTVPGRQVGDVSRLMGGWPPRALWRRRVL